jgi:SOS-response transcriptional repressor LexA
MELKLIKSQVLYEIERLNLNYQQIADKAGLHRDNVRNWLDDRTLKPQWEVVTKITQALNLDNPTPTAPYVGSVRGGFPNEPWADNDAPQIPVSKYVRDGYVLRLDGDSMNKRIPDGSLMLIDPHATDFDKKILIMLIDNATTCKMYDALTNEAVPLSYNLDYKNINLNKHDFRILGRVVQWFDVL